MSWGSDERHVAEAVSSGRCMELLRHGVVARVGVSDESGPCILRVAYRLLESSIVLRCTHPSLVAAARRQERVAFEAGEEHVAADHSWSVRGRGRLSIVEDPAAIEHMASLWFWPGLPAEPATYVSLVIDDLRGEIVRAEQRGVAVTLDHPLRRPVAAHRPFLAPD